MRSLALLGFCLALGFVSARADDFIPLKKGTFWIYKGTVTRIGPHDSAGQLTIQTGPVTWRCEVVGGPYPLGVTSAWLVHGMPGDLVWSDANVQPDDHIIFMIGTDYYDIGRRTDMKGPDTAFDNLKASLASPHFDLDANADEINRASLLCSFPLALGQRFSTASDKLTNEIRTDRYGWLVESADKFDGGKIKGFPSIAHPQVYGLIYRTNPDDSEMSVVPGLGIVGYHYHHHGTPMQVDVDLVEYGTGP